MSEHVRNVVRKCAQSLYTQSSALSRRDRPGSASRLPVSRYSQAIERGLRLMRLNLRRQTIVGLTASKPLSVEELGLDCIRWMGRWQCSSWRTLMTCCSAEFRTPPTTFYMNYCRTKTRITANSGPGAITCH